jgi:hypothetical protein
MKIEENDRLREYLFSLCVCMAYNIEGAHFVLTPTIFAKLYGPQGGLRVFSVGFTFVAVASVINIFILSKFLDNFGWVELGFDGI